MISAGFSPWYHEELAKRIIRERLEKAEQVGEGFCQDYADYRYAVGFIHGMNRALEIAEEIKREVYQ